MNSNLQESSISIRDHRTSKQDKIDEGNCEEHNLFLSSSKWPKVNDLHWRLSWGFQAGFDEKK